MAAIMNELRKIAQKLGVTKNADTIEEMVNAINSALGTKQGNNIEEGLRHYRYDAPEKDITTVTGATVAKITGITDLWGTPVSDIQDDDIAVANGAITGTLKWVDEGQITVDWGTGYFIALSFSSFPVGVEACYVGLDGGYSGLADVYADPDHAALLKIGDIKRQKLKVVTCANGNYKTDYYDLSGLTLEPKDE